MKYIAMGAVITNRLMYTDGRVISDIMGGSGLYSFGALRLCTPESLLVAGVGPDFEQFYGKWFDENNCCYEGLYRPVDKTTYNELVYSADGTYIEYSIYGPEYEKANLAKTIPSAKDVVPFLTDAKGVCVNVYIDDNDADILMAQKEKHPFKVMWEVPASAISELAHIYADGGMAALKARLRGVDIFSTNKPESFEIFGVSSVEDAIKRFGELGMPCYYRVGSKGAYMIEGSESAYVPMISIVPREQEIDPTGCGNTSTAAAMWAYCEGFDLLKTCVVGNVAAAYNVRQYGPYPDMSQKTHDEMMAHVERIYRERKNIQ